MPKGPRTETVYKMPEDTTPSASGEACGCSGVPEQQLRLTENLDREFGDVLLTVPDHSWKGYGLTRALDRRVILGVFEKLKEDSKFLFSMLVDVTCVDWLDQREERFELVYQLLSLTFNHRLCLKVAVPESDPEVDSVRPLWPAANFMEREVWDMFGIKFRGHGDLRRILMYDEFTGHPLRKDYPLRRKQPRVPLRSPELRNTASDMQRPVLCALPVRQNFKTSE